MPSWARKGQRVVCIGGDWDMGDLTSEELAIPDPVKGEVYILADVERDRDLVSGWAVTLVGFSDDDVYCLGNFAPVVSKTQKQDLETHFNHYLDHSSPADLEPVQ